MKESMIEKKLTKYAGERGSFSFKLNSYSTNGLPDRVYLYKGMILFIEIKNASGRLSSTQQHMRSIFRNHGINYNVIYSVQEGYSLIDRFITNGNSK